MALASDLRTANKLRQAGFRHPLTTVQEARAAGLPLSYACAFLEKESGKGLNVFGHDDVRNPVKGGVVTKGRYLDYKKYRLQGLGMQGVGPMQLTYYTLQDRADSYGGCWKPRYNLRVGFQEVASLLKQSSSPEAAAAAYNGVGPAAQAYGRDWAIKQAHWHAYLS